MKNKLQSFPHVDHRFVIGKKRAGACLESTAASPWDCGSFINKAPGSWNCRVERWVVIFYSGVDAAMSAQAGVSSLVSPNIAECVVDWVPQTRWVCLLKQQRSLCILQMYARN